MRIYWGRNIAGFKRPAHTLVKGQELWNWRIAVPSADSTEFEVLYLVSTITQSFNTASTITQESNIISTVDQQLDITTPL